MTLSRRLISVLGGGGVLTDRQMAIILVERHEVHGHFFLRRTPLQARHRFQKRQVAQTLEVRSEKKRYPTEIEATRMFAGFVGSGREAKRHSRSILSQDHFVTDDLCLTGRGGLKVYR